MVKKEKKMIGENACNLKYNCAKANTLPPCAHAKFHSNRTSDYLNPNGYAQKKIDRWIDKICNLSNNNPILTISAHAKFHSNRFNVFLHLSDYAYLKKMTIDIYKKQQQKFKF